MDFESITSEVRRLWGSVFRPAVSIEHRRKTHLEELARLAEAEEGKNEKLEAFLKYKREESEVKTRIQEARTGRERLWSQLGDYGVKRIITTKLVLIVGGLFLFIVILVVSC